jgi:hypothetical protein
MFTIRHAARPWFTPRRYAVFRVQLRLSAPPGIGFRRHDADLLCCCHHTLINALIREEVLAR